LTVLPAPPPAVSLRAPSTALSGELAALGAQFARPQEHVLAIAGKMHDALCKSEKDSTLEHSLFAAFNIE